MTDRDFDHVVEQAGLPVLVLYHQGELARFIGGLGTREEILKQLRLTLNESLQGSPGPPILFNEAIGLDRPTGSRRIFRQPPQPLPVPSFQNFGDPGP